MHKDPRRSHQLQEGQSYIYLRWSCEYFLLIFLKYVLIVDIKIIHYILKI